MSNTIATQVGNIINRPKASNFFQKIATAKNVARATVVSNVLKDAVNCYFYTTQSLHNEKIPEDKRSFVAMLDLANGWMMVLFQLTLGWLISADKVQNAISNALFKKFSNNTEAVQKGKQTLLNRLKEIAENPKHDSLLKDKDNYEEFLKRSFKDIFDNPKSDWAKRTKYAFIDRVKELSLKKENIKKIKDLKEFDELFKSSLSGFKPLSEQQAKLFDIVKEPVKGVIKQELTREAFVSALEKSTKGCKAGIKFLTTVVASTIIAKRAIVPFFSTPLAGVLKRNFMDKKSGDKLPVSDQPAFSTKLEAPATSTQNIFAIYKQIGEKSSKIS